MPWKYKRKDGKCVIGGFIGKSYENKSSQDIQTQEVLEADLKLELGLVEFELFS